MDRTRTPGSPSNRLERTLASLKVVSRLLGHELHAQNTPRLTFSRDEVAEIQTCIDLFIEDALRTTRGAPSPATREVELAAPEARVN
jgi:hypothetical protein